MMTTYLPSVLLMLITYSTTFFKPYFFEAALSVNLTTMLVMTTIFMTVMQMLPTTAYVKMIDIFLIFGQLYPFLEVVLLTIMEYKREGDGSGENNAGTDDEEKLDQPQDKLYWFRVKGGKNIANIVVLIHVLFRGDHSSWSYGLLLLWIHHHSLYILPK